MDVPEKNLKLVMIIEMVKKNKERKKYLPIVETHKMQVTRSQLIIGRVNSRHTLFFQSIHDWE